jgi:hypothetical protein
MMLEPMERIEREEQAPQRDLSVDSGVRKHLEAAFAFHRPNAADTDFISQTVKERSDAVRRASADGKEVRELRDLKPEDRLRQTVRNAVGQEKLKAATAPSDKVQVGHQQFLANQPPASWSTEAKAEFDRLPPAVRKSVLENENHNINSFGRMASEFGEIKKAIEPHRDLIPQGLKEPEVIGNMFQWYRELRGPNRGRAFAELMNQTGTSVQDIVNAAQGQQQQYQQQPQQYQQPMDAETYAVQQTLTQFAQTHPHFENVRGGMGQMLQENPSGFTAPDGQIDLDRLYQSAVQKAVEIETTLQSFAANHPHYQTVRVRMGQILQSPGAERFMRDGKEDLEALYREACRLHGIGDSKDKRAAAVSPGTRSPSAAPTSKAEKGSSIRQSIRAAIQESRGQI